MFSRHFRRNFFGNHCRIHFRSHSEPFSGITRMHPSRSEWLQTDSSGSENGSESGSEVFKKSGSEKVYALWCVVSLIFHPWLRLKKSKLIINILYTFKTTRRNSLFLGVILWCKENALWIYFTLRIWKKKVFEKFTNDERGDGIALLHHQSYFRNVVTVFWRINKINFVSVHFFFEFFFNCQNMLTTMKNT